MYKKNNALIYCFTGKFCFEKMIVFFVISIANLLWQFSCGEFNNT